MATATEDAATAALATYSTGELVDEVVRLTHRIHGLGEAAIHSEAARDRVANLRALRVAARTEIVRRAGQ